MADIEMTPITRKEFYLAGITGMDVQAPSPVTRLESYLNDILNGTVSQLTPLNRVECYLAKISGADVTIPVPVTRLEFYLAAIAGEDIEVPDPVTREEHWLWQWANAGPGGLVETVTGTLPLTLANAISSAIVSLTRYGLCTQDGTPTPDAPVDIMTNNGPLRYGALGMNLLDPSAANTILGYYITKADGEVKPAESNFMFAGYMPVEAGKIYVAYGRAKTGNDLSDYNRIAWYDSEKTWIAGADYTQNRIAVATAPVNAAYARFSCNPSGTTTATVTQELVDSYNWIFAEGTAEIVPFEPFVGGIYPDGTPEVLTVGGPNLLNSATNITGYYIKANGSIATGDDAQYTDLIPVKAGEAYICSLVSGRNSGNNRCHAYDANGGWVKQIAYVSATGQQGARLAMAATIDSGISYVRLSYGITDTEAMVEEAAASIADKFYEGEVVEDKGKLRSLTEIQSPYTSSNASYCPATLYSVIPGKTYAVNNNVPPANKFFTGFYASVDDVTRAAGAVGNATEPSFVAPEGANYAVTVYQRFASGTTYTFDKPMVSEVSPDYQPYVAPQTASVPMLLSVGDVKDEVELISGAYTHRCAACEYDGTQDVGETYLSTTGGKDVGAIIVYPLATPTTEHITAQNLNTNEGTNIVDSVANVGPVAAKVEYMASQSNATPLLG